ncbi:EscU/YscU/HrcU family type III secretion system export apparatus switch protein [Thalassoglobus polymorphus]|uniref:Flagellar biosynthetic protein FlhB n=1 Tax=Thalassoglobus polymorphus TaxID=2527994 RepID=A0A517QMH2_9PLAN|nr:EscU/YscU/HrcU family type III secretion system export apparatus switch protein [Thalassoglobus polymorphus]QDT32823.1 Flagellar biosynthetic protein FlhB [Thalassoglobus polymorphus]
MSETQDQNKTEEATPRKREHAREEGQVVFSPDLSAGVMLCTVSLFVFLFWEAALDLFSFPLTEAFSGLRLREWETVETILAGKWLLSRILICSGVVFTLTTGTALLASQLQSGPTMTFQPLAPKWDKISPASGWSRLLSLDSLFRGGLSILKLLSSIGISLLLFSIAIHEFRAQTAGLTSMNGGTGPGVIGAGPAGPVLVEQVLIHRLLLSLSGITLLWGIVDFAMRRFRHEQKLKMSKQEVKDEQKEDQVDPQIRNKMRRAQQEAAKRRTLQEVPQATMVITNPTHYAVALKYQAGTMGAPVIVAKGTDAFARRIAEIARENGVPVFERKPLTRALFALADVGDEIPMEYYRAIAELLAHVYRIKGKMSAAS